jgi:hypothetical protein
MKGLQLDPETLDLMVTDGALPLGETEQQTVALLLETAPGEWKEYPLLGADARRQLGGKPDPYWALQTKKMIRACGIDVSNVSMADDGSINIV